MEILAAPQVGTTWDEVQKPSCRVFSPSWYRWRGGGGGCGGGNGGGDCEVTITQGGTIIAANGDLARFGGLLQVSLVW